MGAEMPRTSDSLLRSRGTEFSLDIPFYEPAQESMGPRPPVPQMKKIVTRRVMQEDFLPRVNNFLCVSGGARGWMFAMLVCVHSGQKKRVAPENMAGVPTENLGSYIGENFYRNCEFSGVLISSVFCGPWHQIQGNFELFYRLESS